VKDPFITQFQIFGVKTSSTLRLDTTNLSIGFATDDRGGEGKEETFGGSSGSETVLTLIDNETRIKKSDRE
jgi:hypothetical protein